MHVILIINTNNDTGFSLYKRLEESGVPAFIDTGASYAETCVERKQFIKQQQTLKTKSTQMKNFQYTNPHIFFFSRIILSRKKL